MKITVLTARAANAIYDCGIYLLDGSLGGSIKTEMDDSCAFTAAASYAAGYAELKGVTAISGKNAVAFDSENGFYADEDGNPVQKLSFYPERAFNITYENNTAAVTAPEGNYTVIFAAYENEDIQYKG